jgi:hypothetical protein
MQHEGDATWHTYLVEHYRPGSSVEALRRTLRDVRHSAADLARRGEGVRYLRSTIVPGDEAIMAVFEATSERLVRETCARAGLAVARVSQAIQPDDRFEASPQPAARTPTSTPSESEELERSER